MLQLVKNEMRRFLAIGSALSLYCGCAVWSGQTLAYGQSLTASQGSIQGNVYDQNGDNIDGATAVLSPMPSGSSTSTVTRVGGSFSFKELRAGRYRVLVKKAGFTELIREIDLNGNEEIRLSFPLAPDTIRASMNIFEEGDGLQTVFNGLARMSDIHGSAIYAGKKTEVLVLSGFNANLAQGNTRQVFAKVPGTSIWENDGSGLQIGISSRGLDPNRSWEVHTRQNGYDITADIFGYPEAYFTPPLEAVERIELIRGASSLQYGAQFGGLANFILKEAPQDRRFTFTSEQTGGSNGVFNSHNRLGGTIGKLTYNSYYHHRQGDGWRPNSGFDANTGFGSLKYRVNDRLRIGFEFTGMEYLLQMAGGLTDQLFKENPRASIRPRNWFKLQWMVPALKVDYQVDATTRLSLSVYGLRGTRSAVWNSEPVAFPDGRLNLDDPNTPRTLYYDRFRNHGLELRFLKSYNLFGYRSALGGGFRYSNGKTVRQHGFGFPGVEPNFDPYVPDFYRNLHFYTLNFAGFAENVFHLTRKLTITPGVRTDHIASAAAGAPIVGRRERNRLIPLFGIGAAYQVTESTSLYANTTQSYRPTLFNDYWRPDPTIIIDPNLKDMTGYNSEFGWRGKIGEWLNFDIGGFYLKYGDRLGVRTQRNEQGQTSSTWTNISDSRNVGLESFFEMNLLRLAGVEGTNRSLSLFSSIAKIDTKYLGGGLRGNRVEFAPGSIIRSGLTYRMSGLSTTLQYSRVGDQFTDASNTLKTPDASQGLIPAYQTWDLSGSYFFKNYYTLRAGMNNLTDERYFTRRATGYPGPGLVPADGRSFYASIGYRY
jgi:Fe(3+) dicitrate transport protein